MDEFTVMAVVGEIRSVTIEAESQLAAEEAVLSDPRVLIIIDQKEWEELGVTHEEIDTVYDDIDDPKDPVPKVH